LERFSESARQVVELAGRESDRMGHDYLGGEHVLAGIAAQASTRAAYILAGSGLGMAAIRAELDRLADGGVLPPRWRNDAELMSGPGIDLAAVQRAAEDAFGPGAVAQAARRVSRRSRLRGGGPGWTPLCGKAMAAKQAFYLATVEADVSGLHAVGPEHVLLGVLSDAGAPARWTRRTRRTRCGRAYLGFPPRPGPHPVRAVIEARGTTLDALRAAVLAGPRTAT
jgi:ATP-dependent Clp protease ATP-binding subunit ClpC